MSITAECTACGRKYQAPASMAGKRVRCKQCGNIFALPDASFQEEGPDLDSLAELERSFHSMDATDAGGSGVRDSDQGDEDGDDVAPLRMGRSNVRFRFPLAAELDLWLPRILIVGGLAWLGFLCFNRDETGVKWMPYVRLAMALIAFFVFVGPITLIMIRRAGKQLGYQMPTADKFRSYAAYFPAFVIGYAMMLASGGQFVGLVLGCVGGAILATLFLWFFFRLGPAEIAPSATYAVVGFFTGLAVVSAIYFGVNFLILQAMIATKNPDLLPASPFAPSPAMAWLTEDARLDLIAARDKESKPATKPVLSTPTPPPDTTPQVVQYSPIVKTILTAPFTAPFDELIRPMTDSNFRAISRVEGANISVQVWNIDPWRQAGATSFATGTQPWENHYVLSPDGTLLARASEFPRLQAQIWSFAEKRVIHFINLTERRGAKPDLVGFTDQEHVLIRWQGGDGCTLEVRNISGTGEPQLVELPSFELNGSTIVFGHQGNLVAVATRVNAKPTLLVYSLASGQKVSEVAIDSLDPRFPVTPTGMDFSADGKRLALIFEQSGNGLLISYQVDQPQGTRQAEYVYPSGLINNRGQVQFSGSSLQWLPDGKSWLLYGQTVFSVVNGQKIDVLEVPDVERCWVSAPNRAELVVRGPTGQREFQVVQLETEKIAARAGGK